MSHPVPEAVQRKLQQFEQVYFGLNPVWMRGVLGAWGDPRWNSHDGTIQDTLNRYFHHIRLHGWPLPSMDWRYIKAMLWTESGAGMSNHDNPIWRSKPMQIGNSGDPGMGVVLRGEERTRLLIPPDIYQTLTEASIRSQAQANIRAGIGYLFGKLSHSRWVERVNDKDSKVYEYLVQPGDSLERIAQRNGSSVASIQQNTPELNGGGYLRAGMRLKYQKILREQQITRWELFSLQNIADRYNGGGDLAYARKLALCLDVIRLES